MKESKGKIFPSNLMKFVRSGCPGEALREDERSKRRKKRSLQLRGALHHRRIAPFARLLGRSAQGDSCPSVCPIQLYCSSLAPLCCLQLLSQGEAIQRTLVH